MEQLERLIKAVCQMKGSSFDPVDEEWIHEAERDFPGMPEDLKNLYRTLGYGRIGNAKYMIHCLTEPDEIFDESTAQSLNGILVVGDDYGGTCEAYDAKNQWTFGSIGSDGRFEPQNDEGRGFVEFLADWFAT